MDPRHPGDRRRVGHSPKHYDPLDIRWVRSPDGITTPVRALNSRLIGIRVRFGTRIDRSTIESPAVIDGAFDFKKPVDRALPNLPAWAIATRPAATPHPKSRRRVLTLDRDDRLPPRNLFRV